MLQFYFMSVLLNALTGFLLFFRDGGDSPLLKNYSFLTDETVKLVLGILSAFTGLLKILSPIEGDIPVIGDIIPACTNIFCGIILILECYHNRSTAAGPDEDSERRGKLQSVLVHNKKLIGAAAMIAAILHFIFPKVLLL
jgi:hypothetical protein